MGVDTTQIKRLRELTSAGIMDCKRALEETDGNFEKAQAVLMEHATEKAARKSDRAMQHGIIDAYIHDKGRIGVLVEVRCETDFLSKSEAFRSLVKDLALQIASEAPLFIRMEDVPQEKIVEVEAEAVSQAHALGKPNRVVDQIKAGKVQKYLSEVCLMEQRFIKDTAITIGDLVRNFIGTTGENVHVHYFCRRQIAE